MTIARADMESSEPVLDTRAAPAGRARTPALFPAAAPARPYGEGEANSHHGEIVQGVFQRDGRLEHGLVTLPCPLYRTRARFRPLRGAALTVFPGDRLKARDAARLTLDALGRAGWGGTLTIDSNVPVSWGCGSSTSDVLAVIRAVADAFRARLEPAWLARLAVAAETASDSLMYPASPAVLFAQRRGSVLTELNGPLPRVHVLGFNTEVDRGVETLALPHCRYSTWEVESFGPMLGMLRRAVEAQDPSLLGRVASASTAINQRHRPKRMMPQLLRLARDARALGLQVAHSGTVAGFLFEPGAGAADRMEEARAGLRALGMYRTWDFCTSPAPHTERVS